MKVKNEKLIVSGARLLNNSSVDAYCLINDPVIELHLVVTNSSVKEEMEFILGLGMNQLKNMVPADEALRHLIECCGGKEEFATFAVMRLIRLIHLHVRKLRGCYDVFAEVSILSQVSNIRSMSYFEPNLDVISLLFDIRP